MKGQRIIESKETIKIFLSSLPKNSKFNIIKFGTDFEFLSSNSLNFSEKNLKLSFDFIEKIDSNLGGTELYKPLEYLFKKIDLERGYSRFNFFNFFFIILKIL